MLLINFYGIYLNKFIIKIEGLIFNFDITRNFL